MDNYFKKPVNEIVSVLASTGTPGYRVIYTGDWTIYEYNENGLPVKDEAELGAVANVIGQLGDSKALYNYINGSDISLVKTSYFPAGNTMNVTHCIFWGDRYVLSRSDGSDGDIIIVKPNGTPYKVGISSDEVTCMTVDANLNLWIGTATKGVYRVQYEDIGVNFENFTIENGSLPENNISGMVAIGNQVWIITCDTATFAITLFDGFEFSDLTTQFETDTTIDVSAFSDAILYKITQDNGTMYFNFYDTSVSNLIYYEDSLFKIKTLPTAFTGAQMTDFEKKGNYVYSIKSTTGAAKGTAGTIYIWKYSDLTEINTTVYTVKYVTKNENYIVFYSASKIYRTLLSDITDEASWIADIIAIAPNTYDRIVEIATMGTDYLIICHKSNAMTKYNDIIKNIYGIKWVV